MARRIAGIVLAAVLLIGCIPAGAEEWTEKQLLSYYDGCVFVGDSITGQLRTYVLERRQEDPEFMKSARFFYVNSYFLYIASLRFPPEDANNLVLAGKERSLCEIIGMLQPKRVLILLGVNDMVGEKTEKGVSWCERILSLAAEASPETQVIFESLTPVTPRFCRKADYRTMWNEYNAALEAMCLRSGAGYIDIATPLKDGEGYLRDDYCRDGEYHLSDAGLQVWLDSLADYARRQCEAGLWTPASAE